MPLREAEDQNVLHRFFAEVVVDAEDLVLVKDGVDLVVQLARRIEIVAERLLDHHRQRGLAPAAPFPVRPGSR